MRKHLDRGDALGAREQLDALSVAHPCCTGSGGDRFLHQALIGNGRGTDLAHGLHEHRGRRHLR